MSKRKDPDLTYSEYRELVDEKPVYADKLEELRANRGKRRLPKAPMELTSKQIKGGLKAAGLTEELRSPKNKNIVIRPAYKLEDVYASKIVDNGLGTIVTVDGKKIPVEDDSIKLSEIVGELVTVGPIDPGSVDPKVSSPQA